MLTAGIDRDTLMSINEEQLLSECGIKNKLHRLKIQQGELGAMQRPFFQHELLPRGELGPWV
jgi:hypothetical protein